MMETVRHVPALLEQPSSNFAQAAIELNQVFETQALERWVKLPNSIAMMNPFEMTAGERSPATLISEDFYKKFYDDSKPRTIILGINPGRKGSGLTGVPFSDTQRLEQDCSVSAYGIKTHEMSAVYVYEIVKAMGGAKQFYQSVYINSPLPLGLLQINDKNNWINANYYDSKTLTKATLPMIHATMQTFGKMPIRRNKALIFGTSKNYEFIKAYNEAYPMFDELIPLAHPRFVMQYRKKTMHEFIDACVAALH